MKTLVSTLLVISLMFGCASQSPYAPAGQNNGYGYSESSLTSNRYRVSFTGNSRTSSDQVKDYTLLRAAELTLQHEYDWFEVVNRDSDKESRQDPQAGISASRPYHVSRDCGLLGCRTTSSPVYAGVHVSNQRRSDRYTSSMEIVMGSGEPTDPNAIYDASELAQSLRAKMARDE
jgi:flavin-binding protein dodecin